MKMNKKNKKKEKDIIKKILYIVLVIGFLFLMVNSYGLVMEINSMNYSDTIYDLDYLDMNFRVGNYPDLIKAVRVNELKGIHDEVTDEISAIANIYNCAMFYHVYKSIGSEKALMYVEKIDEYKTKLRYKIFLDEYDKLKKEFDLP